MNKILKISLITIVSVIVCYGLLIALEVYRFNKDAYCRPLITVGEIDVDIAVNSDTQKIKYKGLGYTMEYEYISFQKEGSDAINIQHISGDLKLFKNIRLAAWVS